VSWADWERVLAARRAAAETPIKALRHLGPRLAVDEVLLTVTRSDAGATGRDAGSRTATLMTPQGIAIWSETGTVFLQTCWR
jgi:hypothetical protein